MAEDPTVTVDGVEYLPITQARYNELLGELEKSRHARYEGVEEFRVWCQANLGTETVEEGLRACSPDQLMDAVHREAQVSGWGAIINLLVPLADHLNERAKRAERELQAAQQEPIMPEEE